MEPWSLTSDSKFKIYWPPNYDSPSQLYEKRYECIISQVTHILIIIILFSLRHPIYLAIKVYIILLTNIYTYRYEIIPFTNNDISK